MRISISEEAAHSLIGLCQVVSLPASEAKILIGEAQAELEQGLDAAGTKPKLPFGLQHLTGAFRKLLPISSKG